jgi:hypothetical protein
MGTVDIVLLVFLGIVLVGGMVGFFIYNNKEE